MDFIFDHWFALCLLSLFAFACGWCTGFVCAIAEDVVFDTELMTETPQHENSIEDSRPAGVHRP